MCVHGSIEGDAIQPFQTVSAIHADSLTSLFRRRGHRRVSRVVVMIVVSSIAGLVCGIALVWYLIVRGSRAATISEADFNDEYDRLVADGQADEADRDTAWRDFNAWQVTDERERLPWEEAGNE